MEQYYFMYVVEVCTNTSNTDQQNGEQRHQNCGYDTDDYRFGKNVGFRRTGNEGQNLVLFSKRIPASKNTPSFCKTHFNKHTRATKKKRFKYDMSLDANQSRCLSMVIARYMAITRSLTYSRKYVADDHSEYAASIARDSETNDLLASNLASGDSLNFRAGS